MEEGLETPSEEDDTQEELYTIHSASKSRPYYVAIINVDGESMQMEIDTGASLSLVSEQEFWDTWPEREVSRTDITLHSYSGESIPIVGTGDVCVKPILLGRNWLNKLKLNWEELFWVILGAQDYFERNIG